MAKNIHSFRRSEARRLIRAAADAKLKIRGISVDDAPGAAEPPPNPWEEEGDDAQPKRAT